MQLSFKEYLNVVVDIYWLHSVRIHKILGWRDPAILWKSTTTTFLCIREFEWTIEKKTNFKKRYCPNEGQKDQPFDHARFKWQNSTESINFDDDKFRRIFLNLKLWEKKQREKIPLFFWRNDGSLGYLQKRSCGEPWTSTF